MSNNFETNNDNLTQKASKSVLWTLSGNIGVSVLRFISTAIIARILLPHDFGIIGMADLFTGIILLFGNLGMGPALIQNKTIDDEYLSTAFWTSLSVSIFLCLISLCLSPIASYFFNEADVKWVVICLSFNFILSGAASIHATILTRELKFKTLAQIELLSTIVRIAVILLCAYQGLRFWSIVYGILAERTIKTLLLYKAVAWLPKMAFNKEKFHKLFHFGRNLYAESFISYINKNMDVILTGKFLGTANLAFYQFAYNIPHLVLSHVTESVDAVTFPLYCKVQDEKERIIRGYIKTIKFISLITFPLMTGLAFCADDFIKTAYGNKWSAAIIPLRILCISGAVRSIFIINQSLLKSQGKPQMGVKWSLLMFPITLISMTIAAKGGLYSIAATTALLSLIYIVMVKVGINLIGSTLKEYFNGLRPAIISSALMLGVLFIFNSIPLTKDLIPYMRLIINVLLGAAVYILSLKNISKDAFAELMAFVQQMVKRKQAV